MHIAKKGQPDMWNKIIQLILRELAKWLTGLLMKLFGWLLKIVWNWIKRIIWTVRKMTSLRIGDRYVVC